MLNDSHGVVDWCVFIIVMLLTIIMQTTLCITEAPLDTQHF